MASETLLISVLMLSSVRLGKSAEDMINLKCQSAVGVIGQTTNISCSYKSHTEPVIINTVVLTRFRENKPCFTFNENNVTGDSRFKVESLPSLQLHNTSISDEDGYRYYVRTNRGNTHKNGIEFRINVTDNTANSNSISSTQVNIIMGTVGVMVFLAALVLVVLLLKRRCLQQNSPRNPDGVEGETALYKVVYKKAADEDPNTSV